MNQPHGPQVGAELAELYLKGKSTLPLVAGEVNGAADNVQGATIYSAMSRSAALGLGASGCYDSFSAARSSLSMRLETLGQQLDTAGINIMKTARDLADVDAATSTAFRNHGGEFPQ
ncbi:hypothetical protein NPS01_03690 [Nocardioides psychrotolerans]|uniref:Excreted virulence factor EspC, type VII ESX diderm n=1 Tax=Nocardioides psychrotolerans TaxID=1005945 RepID=A0A1I3BD33_9ACTN|nr:hypothetical protein [Nocardioides psychrotolerans]GEP36706.1 hypothetical protein NPS01_03690 [Nocardioides psychrotolerans]SFH60215.1 hypothetical protein SAMN05216561_10171 [Nocardioides psychrotolerans]